MKLKVVSGESGLRAIEGMTTLGLQEFLAGLRAFQRYPEAVVFRTIEEVEKELWERILQGGQYDVGKPRKAPTEPLGGLFGGLEAHGSQDEQI